ncbi:alpha/beta fold hydrolase [Exilibacterium tricleocarpae]|uniref:Alpha/beta fold hydrolase n=1 Tax=Exilibacterium tricleocarpae TaxID=2591008 RepID=A0A545TLI1_9GAMM|nr:alpha/beta hydrolase [Exilibacterium tricleocarpae]TQV78074.1 alpha/beta fold hydrolase [Exilibacterium tricleocarpae]
MKVKLIAACLLAGLLLVLLSTITERRPSPVALVDIDAGVRWVDCWFDNTWDLNIRCGQLTTTGEDGRFTLAFLVFESASAERRPDPLVYLAGGPGAASQVAADQVENWVYWLERADLSRDFIVFDQRGTGRSQPQWGCRQYDRFARRVLASAIDLEEELRRGAEVLRGCWARLARQGFKPDYFSTRASAGDVLLLMEQLGYQRWNLFGVSYGSRLALAVAARRPAGLRSAVLDSVYPLDKGLVSEWPWLLAHALQRFWHYCGVEAACGVGAADLEALFWRQMRQLARNPRTFTVSSWHGRAPYKVVVNDQRLLSIAFSALYDVYTIEKLAGALQGLERGETQLLASLTETFTNYALEPGFNSVTYFAVECADNPPVSEASYQAAVQAFPDLAAYTESAWRYDVCPELAAGTGTSWRPPQLAGAGGGLAAHPPMLLLSGGLDPVTPPEWAVELAARRPNSQHLVFEQIGHAVVSSSDCVHQLLRAYLDAPGQPLSLDCGGSPP